MKGATPVPERNIRAAKTKRAIISGRSHHFLFSFMKLHSSPANPPRGCSAAAFSNSLCFWSLIARLYENQTPASNQDECPKERTATVPNRGSHDLICTFRTVEPPSIRTCCG